MEKLQFLPTETQQVQNVACEMLWTGPDVHPVQLHKGDRKQLNLGVKERGPGQTLNTHEIFT
jgi:hypothetical protein